MNSVSSYGFMSRTQKFNYHKPNFNKSSCNVSFSSRPISKEPVKNSFSFFSTILSKLKINRNKENKQLIKQIDNLLKDESYVKDEYSSFSSPEVKKFIFSKDGFVKNGILPNIGCVYKADNHYVIQTWQDGIATFKKLDKKGNLIGKMELPARAL